MKIVFELEKESKGWVYRQSKIYLEENNKRNINVNIKTKEEKGGQLKLVI